MEFKETTLTTGVAVPVTASTVDNAPRVDSEIRKETFSDGNRVEERNELADSGSENVSKVEQNPKKIELADKVLESAKEEGFVESLTHLAEGDFDEVEIEEQHKKEVEEAEDAKLIEETASETQENEEDIVQEDNERSILADQIRFLEKKVNNLEEQNKKLAERLGNVENRNQMSKEDLLEALLILKSLAEKEKDQQKKIDMLAAIVTFLENVMIMMFVPDGEKVIDEKNKEQAEEPQEEGINTEKVIQLMEYLEAKRLNHQQDEQPTQAA